MNRLLAPAFRDAGVRDGALARASRSELRTVADPCRLVHKVEEQIRHASRDQIRQYARHARKIIEE